MSSSAPDVFTVMTGFEKNDFKYVEKINFCQSTFCLRVHTKRFDRENNFSRHSPLQKIYPVNHFEENQIFAPDTHFTRNFYLFCLLTKRWVQINFSIIQRISTLLPNLFVAE